MKYQSIVRTAAGVLAGALLAGGALAQAKQAEPTTMTDTAPVPAQDRSSVGAVILMDEPVIAQREQMQTAMERSAVDTRVLGAGPARTVRKAQTQTEIDFLKAMQAADRQKATPK